MGKGRPSWEVELGGGSYDCLDQWGVRQTFDGTIIVPMTLVDPVYFAEIVGRLRAESGWDAAGGKWR
jgi:hypothetical protein